MTTTQHSIHAETRVAVHTHTHTHTHLPSLISFGRQAHTFTSRSFSAGWHDPSVRYYLVAYYLLLIPALTGVFKHVCRDILHVCRDIPYMRRGILHVCRDIPYMRRGILHVCRDIPYMCRGILHVCRDILHMCRATLHNTNSPKNLENNLFIT
jgi:hypothetical protein